jgi:hypothetical protein
VLQTTSAQQAATLQTPPRHDFLRCHTAGSSKCMLANWLTHRSACRLVAKITFHFNTSFVGIDSAKEQYWKRACVGGCAEIKYRPRTMRSRSEEKKGETWWAGNETGANRTRRQSANAKSIGHNTRTKSRRNNNAGERRRWRSVDRSGACRVRSAAE